MSSLVFLVVALVGAVVVGSLRSVHLGLVPSESRIRGARESLRRSALDVHAGEHESLPDPSIA
jgi:hypothetical protein